MSACSLSKNAVLLTRCGPGTETDAGNMAAHQISQATVHAAIEAVCPAERGLWKQLFDFVYRAS